MSFAVFTDTSSNLPESTLQENDIRCIAFPYIIDGNAHTLLDCDQLDDAEYYGAVRNGTKVSTSQINPVSYADFFRPTLEQGLDVLYVSMSGGISGSFNSAQIAADELKEEFPDRTVLVFDSETASLGEGLQVLKAAKLRDEGMDIQAVYDALTESRAHMCSFFTVDDLIHLKRTGRVSVTAAVAGTVLHIKPILRGLNGKIVAFRKVRGRRSAVKELADLYLSRVTDWAGQTIGIAHAACKEDADKLIELISAKAPAKILTVKYEPVTGSHVGPGALALFFLGNAANT